ncbi:hypothetical protein KW843_23655 [Acidovorax sp. sif1233]|uniref:hypothetical protein n=1 Tax=Acidovorax sp. sif1233 TaxID=2854792 RepID=UPI001C477DBF|nr:hypothetical protein [Acidovorax sp. sif1233]MBV7457489.1 hypothetical protein [Acidovorax sp. sif1233]
MTHDATCNAAFRCNHMGRLLHRMGTLLPQWLNGPDLARECRDLEQLCWPELGYPRQPIFDGDLPAFLMVDGDCCPVALLSPADPIELANRLAAFEPSPPPAESCIGTNLDTLARLLNLTPFECRWLLWSHCVKRFGRTILPVIPMRDATHGCNVLALLCEMPVDTVRDAVASRRLHTWGFLDGIGADGAMPSLLSGWLSATDQFADWIEQPYASNSDLLAALCQAQFR